MVMVIAIVVIILSLKSFMSLQAHSAAVYPGVYKRMRVQYFPFEKGTSLSQYLPLAVTGTHFQLSGHEQQFTSQSGN